MEAFIEKRFVFSINLLQENTIVDIFSLHFILHLSIIMYTYYIYTDFKLITNWSAHNYINCVYQNNAMIKVVILRYIFLVVTITHKVV